MTNEKIKKRMAKILSLAEKAGTEEEAIAAFEKAIELSKKYGVTIEEAKRSKVSDFEEFCLYRSKQRITKWRIILASGVSALFDCQCLTVRSNLNAKIIIRGFSSDAFLAKEMHSFVESAMNRALARRKTEDKTINNNFYRLGFISRITNRLRNSRPEERIEDSTAEGRSLIVVKQKAIDANYNSKNIKLAAPLKMKRPTENELRSGAIGDEDAEKVNLNNQIK